MFTETDRQQMEALGISSGKVLSQTVLTHKPEEGDEVRRCGEQKI